MLWNAFISKAKNATFLFYRDFMEYHQDRFDDYSLMVYKDNTLVAVLPAHKKNTDLYSHNGLSYGGLVLEASLRLSEVITCYATLFEHLNSVGIKQLYVKPIPDIYSKVPSNEHEFVMFKLEAQLKECHMLSVVTPSNYKLSKDRKTGVKRGQKNGLTVKEEQDLTSFWNDILVPNLNEKYEANPVHSLDEIQHLKAQFPKAIRQFNVYHHGDLVAGTTIFESKRVAHSQYTSSASNKNSLGSLDFLHHHLLEKVYHEKDYFDFGSSSEHKSQNINESLLYFKEGYGARSIPLKYYCIKTKDYGKLNDVFI